MTREIIELQRRINRDLRQHTLGAWLELNLTIPQLKSLFFIANQGTTNFTTLSAALRVTPANVTGIIDRLVGQGLVHRQENPENRRVQLLSVTEKGEAIISSLRERRASRTEKILGHLTREELKEVSRGLSLLERATKIDQQKTHRDAGKT